MRVYIEYALADNLFFDWVLLYAVSFLAKNKRNFWQLFFGAAVGAIGAVAVSLLDCHWAILLCIKTILLFAIVLCAFGTKNIKKIPYYALLFTLLTFALGGCILGIFYLAKIDFALSDTIFYVLKVPIGVIAAGLFCFGATVVYLFRYIEKTKKIKKFGCEVVLVIGNEKILLQGFFDSGNTLLEKGRPVCFLCDTKATSLLKKNVAKSILQGNAILKNVHFVNFVTVSGSAKTAVFEAEEMYINGKKTQSWLAFGNASTMGFDILVNIELSEAI